jgi:glycosyltransferase involved in cell wall biosynthesis
MISQISQIDVDPATAETRGVTQPRVSLIIATISGRRHVLERCLASIDEQSYRDFEGIVIDQGSDPETRCIVERFPWARYVATAPVGLSASRNYGVAEARGELLVFPDDDATLARDMLKRVSEVFRLHPELGLLSVAVVDPSTGRRIFRFPAAPSTLTVWNVMTRHCSASLVVHRRVLNAQDQVFDPMFGVGVATPFGSGEETDLVLRLLLARVPARYEPSIVVYHPNTTLAQVPLAKINSYGRGCGACFRKACGLFGWWPVGAVWSWICFRACAGVVIDTLRGRLYYARLRVRSLIARIDGWRLYGEWRHTHIDVTESSTP